MTRIQTIYFDESGFTGSNLLNVEQPAFVYAGVAIDPDEASRLHTELVSRLSTRSDELKGKNLVRTHKGRAAISWLLSECRDNACVTIANKNFALAGKFYEYVFEPILRPQNSLFYAVGFHRFISNFLYICFQARSRRAEKIMTNFEALMRTQDLRFLNPLLAPKGISVEFRDPLNLILTFGLCHSEKIKEEIQHLSKVDGVSRWALELTTTSLFWILSYWSERFESMEVYCDKSHPLEANRSVFNTMIGREDKIYMKLGNQPERSLTYNLARPVELLDSKQSSGIQIADIISSSVAFALKEPEDELSKKWLDLVSSMTNTSCILPDLDAIDLSKRDPFINGLILHELVDRTLKGKSIFSDMPSFISTMRRAYKLSPPPIPKKLK
jgi:hypothetical protein